MLPAGDPMLFARITRQFHVRRRQLLCLAMTALLAQIGYAASKDPVLIGVDGEFGLVDSTSAQAVALGIKIAMAEINASGGVLGGRPLELVTKDHRSIPARGIRNIEEFAATKDMVAVFGGRFSPVIIEELPKLKETKLLFMAPWSSADSIIDNGMQPNYIFRLSLRDSLAMPKMLQIASERKFGKVGLLLTNTSWGRSNLLAAKKYADKSGKPRIVQTAWYNFTEKTLLPQYKSLLDAGAQAIVLVANDDEAATLVREMATLPENQRVPILSHWGITGGEFVKQAGPALQKVDLSVIQTFSFFNADKKVLEPFMQTARKVAGIERIDDIKGPVGVAHAYDLMHILARAIDMAGTTERPAVRDALEKIRTHKGLVKRYAPPFTPTRHEALGPGDLLMARYRDDGVLVPVTK
jgi:branched-chain amino acid transport system substrate-binding protein